MLLATWKRLAINSLISECTIAARYGDMIRSKMNNPQINTAKITLCNVSFIVDHYWMLLCA